MGIFSLSQVQCQFTVLGDINSEHIGTSPVQYHSQVVWVELNDLVQFSPPYQFLVAEEAEQGPAWITYVLPESLLNGSLLGTYSLVFGKTTQFCCCEFST